MRQDVVFGTSLNPALHFKTAYQNTNFFLSHFPFDSIYLSNK